jgi:hypothetical protein
MKHDAIVDQGIPIHERVPIPEDMIPADSRVEIDAKIHAGYCKPPTPYNNHILHLADRPNVCAFIMLDAC